MCIYYNANYLLYFARIYFLPPSNLLNNLLASQFANRHHSYCFSHIYEPVKKKIPCAKGSRENNRQDGDSKTIKWRDIFL